MGAWQGHGVVLLGVVGEIPVGRGSGFTQGGILGITRAIVVVTVARQLPVATVIVPIAMTTAVVVMTVVVVAV